MNLTKVREHKNELYKIATTNNISRVRIFGSVAQGTAENDSDIDFLVTTTSQHTLLDRIAFRQQAEQILGIEVDVIALKNLDTQFKKILVGSVDL